MRASTRFGTRRPSLSLKRLRLTIYLESASTRSFAAAPHTRVRFDPRHPAPGAKVIEGAHELRLVSRQPRSRLRRAECEVAPTPPRTAHHLPGPIETAKLTVSSR